MSHYNIFRDRYPLMVNLGQLLLLFLLCAFLLHFFYPQLEAYFLYHPDSKHEMTPSSLQLRYEDVYLSTEDNVKLHGWFFSLDNSSPVMLFCHGNAGNISHRLENVMLLLSNGIQVFIFDYRGYGKSTGKPTEKGLYEDGLAAYDFLVENKKFQPRDITVFGRSLGAAIAIEIAVNRDVGSLIIESGFTSIKDMSKTMIVFLPFRGVIPSSFNNLEKIRKVSAPKLFIHGDNDDLVPYWMGKKLFEYAKPPKTFFTVKNAGHNNTYEKEGAEYFHVISKFLKNHEARIK